MSSSSNNKNNNNNLPRVDGVKDVGSTKWLKLQTISWTDLENQPRLWDMASRTTKQPNTADAVVILPLLKKKGFKTQTIFVEQFRPPIANSAVEFPAGLIDRGETIQEAAVRELREETGYFGTVRSTSDPVCMSPGLCNETVVVVVVDVDLDDPRNQTPQTELEDGEHVITKLVDLDSAMKTVLDQGASMPIMGLYLFALGYELGASSASNSSS